MCNLPQDAREWYRLFKRVDIDGSGSISYKELAGMAREASRALRASDHPVQVSTLPLACMPHCHVRLDRCAHSSPREKDTALLARFTHACMYSHALSQELKLTSKALPEVKLQAMWRVLDEDASGSISAGEEHSGQLSLPAALLS